MFGPGQESNASAHENMPGVTTFRVSSKDRSFVDELLFKGWRLRLGDWVHASNPDDPSRPIVGQVYRCYVSDEQ
jgi:chromatin structure-remodeling complex subunit RSC1/2